MIGLRIGGLKTYRKTDLTNTKTEVRAAPTLLGGFNLYNPDAAATFIQFYDALAANVTVGTTTPKLSLFLPIGAALDNIFPYPIEFETAITIAATTTATGSTAPGAAQVVNLYYN